ncbi:MAG: hypothetical protein OEW09_10755, partial [Anaerolineae bacterium]|nr:hypothetical protein [Anaerolineae bacterium]
YAQVDSSNAATSYGAVMESDESNNVSDPPATVPGAGIAPLPVTTEKPERDISKTSLPPRP